MKIERLVEMQTAEYTHRISELENLLQESEWELKTTQRLLEEKEAEVQVLGKSTEFGESLRETRLRKLLAEKETEIQAAKKSADFWKQCYANNPKERRPPMT